MSASNQLAGYLPLVPGALLVGAAIAGSRLSAGARLRVQRFILLPLMVLVGAASIWLASVQQDLVRAAILGLTVVSAIPRLFSRTTASARQAP